jgi:cation transport ATPase
MALEKCDARAYTEREMSICQVSFPIQGMYCAKSAVMAEAGIARLEGVMAARINYAAQRATVILDPSRVRAEDLVLAVRAEKLDVPLEQVQLRWGDWRRFRELSTSAVVTAVLDWRRACLVLQLVPLVITGLPRQIGFRSLMHLLLTSRRET